MRKIFALTAILLLLCGCGKETPPPLPTPEIDPVTGAAFADAMLKDNAVGPDNWLVYDFAMIDLSGDSVPELVLQHGGSRISHIYTYDGTQVVLCDLKRIPSFQMKADGQIWFQNARESYGQLWLEGQQIALLETAVHDPLTATYQVNRQPADKKAFRAVERAYENAQALNWQPYDRAHLQAALGLDGRVSPMPTQPAAFSLTDSRLIRQVWEKEVWLTADQPDGTVIPLAPDGRLTAQLSQGVLYTVEQDYVYHHAATGQRTLLGIAPIDNICVWDGQLLFVEQSTDFSYTLTLLDPDSGANQSLHTFASRPRFWLKTEQELVYYASGSVFYRVLPETGEEQPILRYDRGVTPYGGIVVLNNDCEMWMEDGWVYLRGACYTTGETVTTRFSLEGEAGGKAEQVLWAGQWITDSQYISNIS